MHTKIQISGNNSSKCSNKERKISNNVMYLAKFPIIIIATKTRGLIIKIILIIINKTLISSITGIPTNAILTKIVNQRIMGMRKMSQESDIT